MYAYIYIYVFQATSYHQSTILKFLGEITLVLGCLIFFLTVVYYSIPSPILPSIHGKRHPKLISLWHYNAGPPSCKMVYKPHPINYSGKYHTP